MKSCSLKTNSKKLAWYENEIQKMDAAILEQKLAQPALRALVNASIYTVQSLRSKSIKEIKTLHGFGPAAVQKLKKLIK